MRIDESQSDDTSRNAGQGFDAFLESSLGEARKLHEQVDVLPSVDKDGNSECPFAQELYAKKDQLERQLRATLDRLYDCEKYVASGDPAVWTECYRHLGPGDETFKTMKPSAMFTEAEGLRERPIRKLVAKGDRIAEAIERVQHELAKLAGSSFREAPSRVGQSRLLRSDVLHGTH